ncbi:MAG: FtsX-like permease family protein [Chromatiales bacterium]|nr:FtsX-like permease family protein [Chromatiales bacterium]
MSAAGSIALRFAWRELRHGARALRGFGVFLGCLALGVAAIAGVQSTASSIVTGLRADGRAILGGDLALRSIYQDLAPAERRLLEKVSEAITHFAEMRTMARHPGAEASVLVELKAVDDRYPLFGRLETRGGEGAGASPVTALARRGDTWGALVDPALADRLGLADGDALSVGGIDFEVRGIIAREPDRAGSGAPFGFWPRVLVSLDGLAATQLLREGSLVYHQYAARLAPEVRLEDVRAELGHTFRDSGWQMRTYDDAAPGIQRMIGRLGSFLSLVGLTALLVGGVGVGNAVRAWLDTRLGVIATLKCIGASRAVVFRTYLVQLTVIAGLGVIAGLAIGAFAPVVVSAMLETLLPFPIALGIYPGVLAVAVAFGLLTAVTFTVWPLSRAHETPAVALFRGVGLGVRPGRRGHLALALAGGAGLALLAVATAPNRWFAVWFIAGGALVLIVFRVAGWAVLRAARAVHESSRPRAEGVRSNAPVARRTTGGPLADGPSGASAAEVPGRWPHDASGPAPREPAGGWSDRLHETSGPAPREPAGGRSDRSHETRRSGSGFRRLRLGPRMRMAVSNLYRPGNATADIVLSLGLGLTVLVAVALVEANLRREIADSLPEDAPAFFFVGVESDRIDRLTETVESIQGTERFRSVPFLRGRIVRVNGLDPEEALVNDEHGWLIRGDRGLSYATAAPDNPVVDGEWWPEDYAGPPLLSVDVDVIDAFELALGDTITLNVLGREITAEVRHVRRVEWQGMQVNFALLLSPEPLRRAPHSYVATVGATPEAEVLVERTLVREFPQVTTVRVREALGRVAELMGSIAAAARGVGGVTLLSGALVLAGAVAAGHRRRTYESVVLKVLGVRRRDVILVHAAEFALLGLVTGVIAAAAGTLTAWGVTTQVLEQDWTFLPGIVAGTVGFCVALTLSLGLVGTWRALGESAAPHLRNE